MYENSKNIDCKKNFRRTPSNSLDTKPVKILLMKKTKDSDLFDGLRVCYKNINGVYSKLGNITDSYKRNGVLHYLINSSFGAYTADELKLLK